jgi:hypothetical protein
MKDFEEVYLDNNEWPDHLVCNHCGKRVERGILHVSSHFVHCFGKEFNLALLELAKKKNITENDIVELREKHLNEII